MAGSHGLGGSAWAHEMCAQEGEPQQQPGFFGKLWSFLTGRGRPKGAQPNAAAAVLLRDPGFRAEALAPGAECGAISDQLMTAAGGRTGGVLSISPPAGAETVKIPTATWGVVEALHHQVFTDGNFVFDPWLGETPVPRAAYEAQVRQLNGPGVEIGFFPAQP